MSTLDQVVSCADAKLNMSLLSERIEHENHLTR